VIWLGWRGPDDTEGKAHAGPAAVAAAAKTTTADSENAVLGKRAPDNNAVGGSLAPPSGKPSAGDPVRFASEMDVLVGKKPQVHRSPLLGDVAANLANQHEATSPQTGTQVDPQSDATVASQPPSIPAIAANETDVGKAPAMEAPAPSLPLSQGVSGGELMHRVTPVYPAQARLQRLEGTVVLSAMVMEDGTISDVKVVEGSMVLAQSAIDAVQQWRYKPFELDGKPVKNEIRINVDFKFPSQ
jgi:TonB family protein